MVNLQRLPNEFISLLPQPPKKLFCYAFTGADPHFYITK